MIYLIDYITNGFAINFLFALSVISIYSGILVITTKNPIVSVIFLISLFFFVACYLIITGLTFIGLSYLLVYVGAISILFLFILMLINIRVSELLSQTRNSMALVAIVSCLIYFIITNALPNNEVSNVNSFIGSLESLFGLVTNITNTLGKAVGNIYITSGTVWDANIIEDNPMASMGNIMFTLYPMWLIITSLILLLGMTGIIVITISSSPTSSTPKTYSFVGLPKENNGSAL